MSRKKVRSLQVEVSRDSLVAVVARLERKYRFRRSRLQRLQSLYGLVTWNGFTIQMWDEGEVRTHWTLEDTDE